MAKRERHPSPPAVVGEPKADRGPDRAEVAAAERAARTVDVDEVRKHESEMNELGKDVQGEGRIG